MTTISTKDALAVIKKNLKLIVICALAFGIIAGAYKGISELKASENLNSAGSAPTGYNEKLEKYNLEKSDIAEVCAAMEEDIASAYRFANENPVMALDPSGCKYSVVVVDYIDSQANENNNVRGIISKAEGAQLFEDDIELLSKYRDDIMFVDMSIVTGETAIYVYEVKGIDSHKLATRLSDLIYKEESMASGISSIQITDNSNSPCQVLYNRQREIRNNAFYLQYDLRQIKEFDRMIEAPSATETAPGKATIIISVIRFGIIGVFLGAIVGILLVLFKATQGGRIISREQFEDLFALEYLGSLSGKDRDSEAALSNIEVLSDNNAKVLVVDKNNLATVNELVTNLNNKRTSNKYNTGKDIIEDTDTVRRCADSDTIVFVVEKGSTSIESIQKQVRRAENLGKHILGYLIA